MEVRNRTRLVRQPGLGEDLIPDEVGVTDHFGDELLVLLLLCGEFHLGPTGLSVGSGRLKLFQDRRIDPASSATEELHRQEDQQPDDPYATGAPGHRTAPGARPPVLNVPTSAQVLPSHVRLRRSKRAA